MKTLYLDCFSGISGDMFLGAMLDLGLDEKFFLDELHKLPLEGYEVEIKKSENGGVVGTDVCVKAHEHHPHRGLKHIYEIIDGSGLTPEVKQKTKDAFLKLAIAEGKIHGKPPEQIHFHEVGAVDSIVDIVGAHILMDMLKPDKVCASPVNVGSGTVECAHGVLPVPAPATVELLQGVPVFSRGEAGELTTPTGALLLSTFVHKFGNMPQGSIERTGYGLGKARRSSPNVLRAVLMKHDEKWRDDGCAAEAEFMEGSSCDGFDRDRVSVLEANIDDMNPQFYDEVMGSLLAKGALDVFLTPIIMKKTRPAVKLTCICPEDKKDLLAELILRDTTTIGVREYVMSRTKLFRQMQQVNTPFGSVRVKVSKKGDEIIKKTPEYEDLKKLAQEKNMPINKLSTEILKFIE
ncbi:MAG: nickel pincer cofactor biosynthesis protein LarC [Tepidanaerobacteraceae bacterium]|jgi:uncharacterized protein (TIGR00299 family) protein|nr:nickel pincer cofactor biosynthesis protein LarC [Tepidanaerobacteraceae bacterium]